MGRALREDVSGGDAQTQTRLTALSCCAGELEVLGRQLVLLKRGRQRKNGRTETRWLD